MNVFKRFWSNLRELAHKEGFTSVFNRPQAEENHSLARIGVGFAIAIIAGLSVGAVALSQSLGLSFAMGLSTATSVFLGTRVAFYFLQLEESRACRQFANVFVAPVKMVTSAAMCALKGIDLKEKFSTAATGNDKGGSSASNATKVDQTLNL